MRKRSLILFLLLFIFWIVISEEADIQHILAGAFIALITVWFWYDLESRQPLVPTIKELFILTRCFVMLAGYVIQANISVAKTLLLGNPMAKPMFVVMEPEINSGWGRVLLATCITITPGTITVDINPDTGQFIVHSLTEEAAIDLSYWRIINEVKKLENNKNKVSIDEEVKN